HGLGRLAAGVASQIDHGVLPNQVNSEHSFSHIPAGDLDKLADLLPSDTRRHAEEATEFPTQMPLIAVADLNGNLP
ncbi:hypothetical protein SB758_41730, partial [Burkholderia sp. SIMBA_013]